MIKKFYIFAWLLLVGAAVVSVRNGTFGTVELIAASVGAVGLIYAFALWAVTREPDTAQRAR